MHRNWLVSRTNPEFLGYISKQLSISPVLAQIIVNRGINNLDLIRAFLNPSLDALHDPFLLPDMDKAVERLKTAISRKETALVHGDYDADGVTATALLVSTLTKLGLKTLYHIPHRINEGYGMSRKGIQKAKDAGASLIITVDCGISSAEEVFSARSMGMDVIVTDHHEPPAKLPEATAVIDPHIAGSVYPFKNLAGVGVAFKLVQALFKELRVSEEFRAEELLDIVALGTVADSVPLIGENRVFVTQGLKQINNDTCRPGIQAMKEVVRIAGDFRSGQLSFTMIPRINAAGRIDDAGEVVKLLLTEDIAFARGAAGLLDEQNRKRQKIEGDVLKSALDMIDPDKPDPAIILSSRDWHPGVSGIVASRLVDRFSRPVFIFSEKDGVAKGSARGINNFHLYQAIAECSELLIAFGGHRQAAGLKISIHNLPAFRERMNSIVRGKMAAGEMAPMLEIDAAVNFTDLNFKLVNELSLLEPYGTANPEPVFGARNIEIIDRRTVGNNHLKMQLKQKSLHIETIGFSMANQMENLPGVSSLDIAFVPCINEWNGKKSLQLNLKGIRPGS